MYNTDNDSDGGKKLAHAVEWGIAMKKRVWKHTAAVVLMGTLLLTGCGSNSDENAVSVQAVSDIATINVSGVNRYSGIVESHSVQKIKKSSKKKVAKCFVKEGDVVHKGDALFRYDTSSLELELESMKLELEKMQSEIDSYTSQINELTKERNKASANKRLSYSLEIQEAQLNKAEAEYNRKKKQQEYAKLQKSQKNTVVHAKISGVVQSVNSDSKKDSKNYIVIRGNRSYRVKGTASELNIGTLSEGEEVQVISRIDDSQRWSGTINKISEEQASDDSSDEDSYIDSSSGESATKYNFYVQLEDSDKLLMGQHVYIQPGASSDETNANAMQLSSSYLVQNDDGSYYVWAANSRNKLEKRSVTVGDYNEYTDTYAILDGLSKDDYIAFPEDGLEEGQKTKQYEESQTEEQTGDEDTSTLPDGEIPAMSTDGAEG